ncbi:hypothetical protein ON010_g7620 [Phytophthora cinnamomi]|nr:hypothetical protein ON010_g7620 [Phytophthora cinnamomi]
MARYFADFSATPLNYGPRPLGDSLVGPVISHVQANCRHSGVSTISTVEEDVTTSSSSRTNYLSDRLAATNTTSTHLALNTVVAGDGQASELTNDNVRPVEPKQKQARNRYKTSPRRREQCRANQNRYRKRQKEYQNQLELDVEQLRRENGSMAQRHQHMSSDQICNQSPWGIVANVFRLIEADFRAPWSLVDSSDEVNQDVIKHDLAALEKAFTVDVEMGGLTGVQHLRRQLQRYSQYFGQPQICLQKLEKISPGVITATAKFSLTVSKFTLRCVFPHLKKMPRIKYDTEPPGARLLGQRLACACLFTFFFDEETNSVARLAVNIDWITPLLQVLGAMRDVSKVLNGAFITTEGIITDSTNVRAPHHGSSLHG